MFSIVWRSIRAIPPNTIACRTCTSSSYKPIRRPRFPANNDQAAVGGITPPTTTAAAASQAQNGPAVAVPPLAKRLQMRIQAAGPITVAQYMKEVLTNWSGGYYTSSKEVFGQHGDFITSPEIGQIFGELIGVWLYAEWQKCGAPKPLQLIELGPGRGTLVQDVVRVLSKLGLGAGDLSVHLVEISPFLSEVQSQRLCLKSANVQRNADGADGVRHYRSGETVSGIPVFWYEKIEDVPEGFAAMLAHEFFDALPVHKFQKQDDKWREVLVDCRAEDGTFSLVASKAETVMLRLFLQNLEATDERQHVEHSFEAQQIIEHLCMRLERNGGFGLIMDYGHNGDGTDTFRAFKSHKLHDPLVDPGAADLTADVDFRLLKRACETDDRLITFGPVEQGTFLQRLGGRERLDQLMAGAEDDDTRKSLQSGYDMLTTAEQMGTRFKFFSMFPAVLRDHLKRFPVNGFQ